MSLTPTDLDVLVATDDARRGLRSSFQKKLASLSPRRRVSLLACHEIDSAAPGAVIVWLAAAHPPPKLLADPARIVLLCIVGGRRATFASGLGTYAQMGRGYACPLSVARLGEADQLREVLERRIKIQRHAGPSQSHAAATAAAVMVHQWLVRSASAVAAGKADLPLPRPPVRARMAADLALRLVVAGCALVARLSYGVFGAQRWRVGHLANPSIEGLAARLGEVTWWPELARGEFLADPFIESQEPPVILCEWKRPEKGRGVIARVRYDGTRRALDVAEVLDGEYAHLSYPNFVAEDGATYLFPECAQSGRLTKYRLDDRGLPVLPGETLCDQPLIDATLLRHDGRWWLFGTLPGAAESESHLYLFSSPDLSGSWAPHPLNPVVIDPACARPAGKIIVRDGRLIRPAQDCERRYGNGLAFMEITALSTEHYEERLLTRVTPPAHGFPRHGIHTFNIVESAAGSTAILDAYTVRFDPLAWFDRLMERPRFRQILGKGSSGKP